MEVAERFYGTQLGCPVGRRSESWIDFDFGGHQITTHLVESGEPGPATNGVDGDQVPTRHFGLVLPMEHWRSLAAELQAADVTFRLEPRIRFEGQPGEQATMFVEDGCGNALEFKAFADPARLFAR